MFSETGKKKSAGLRIIMYGVKKQNKKANKQGKKREKIKQKKERKTNCYRNGNGFFNYPCFSFHVNNIDFGYKFGVYNVWCTLARVHSLYFLGDRQCITFDNDKFV